MQNLDTVIKQHPQSVALLFAKYGYTQLPLTEKSALALAVKFGPDFINEFSEIIAAQYDVFVGANGLKSLIQKVIKPTQVRRDTRNVNASPVLLGTVLSPAASLAPVKIDPNYAAKKVEEMKVGANSAPEKISLKDKIAGLFKKVLPVLQQGAAIVATAKGYNNPAYDPVYIEQQQQQRNTTTWLIIGVVVIALLTLFLYKSSPEKVVK